MIKLVFDMRHDQAYLEVAGVMLLLPGVSTISSGLSRPTVFQFTDPRRPGVSPSTSVHVTAAGQVILADGHLRLFMLVQQAVSRFLRTVKHGGTLTEVYGAGAFDEAYLAALLREVGTRFGARGEEAELYECALLRDVSGFGPAHTDLPDLSTYTRARVVNRGLGLTEVIYGVDAGKAVDEREQMRRYVLDTTPRRDADGQPVYDPREVKLPRPIPLRATGQTDKDGVPVWEYTGDAPLRIRFNREQHTMLVPRETEREDGTTETIFRRR